MQVGKHRMLLYPGENRTDFNLWYRFVTAENQSLTALEERVKGKAALIFDIGANCGSYSLRLADAAGPGTVIHAFEPNPVMFGRLQKNLSMNSLNSRVEVHNCALGPEKGSAILEQVPGNLGQATMRRPGWSRSKKIEVDVEPLWAFFDSPGRFDRTIVKIDVEGYEDRVLNGLFDQIPEESFPDDILIETAHKKKWLVDVTEDFRARGYESVLKCEGNTLFTLSKPESEK